MTSELSGGDRDKAVAAMRETVSALHSQLTAYGLVAWTSGNVSGRVPGHDLMVIKPSGIGYDDLTPESMIVCDLDGVVVEGDLSPSSDTAAHAYVYREMPEVGWRRPHPLDLRVGVVRARRGGAVRTHRDGRRVRRRDPARAVRAHR